MPGIIGWRDNEVEQEEAIRGVFLGIWRESPKKCIFDGLRRGAAQLFRTCVEEENEDCGVIKAA